MRAKICDITPPNWSVRPIADVCRRVTSGGTPSRERPDYYVNGTIPWVKTQELKDRWIDKTEELVTREGLDNSSAKLLPPKTILLALYGATVGQLGLLRREMTCNQACCALIVDESEADFRYLFYQLLFARPQFKSLAVGAAQQNLSGLLIKEFQLPFPSLAEQRAVAAVLSSLDDKVELNRRMNETLEALAQSLFKSRFVDASQTGLPDGWREGSILEVAKLLSGGTPKTEREDYWNGSILWASAKDVSQCGQTFLVSTERTITKKGLEESATQLIPALCTVVVARGATTGRMTIFGREMAMNQTCYGLASTTGTPFALYFLFRHAIDDLLQTAHGSVFDTITTSTFAASKVILPPQDVFDAFEKAVSPIFARILSNIEESRTLAALREALLPKLLSGELRVPVERISGGKE